MGVAIGDYDNDGFDDIFVTALGQNHLFHNNGNGTFTDVTKQAGLWGPNEFSTSAAWVDYDRDGHLDLVVANYVQWSPAERYLLHARRKNKIVLHAGVLPGNLGSPMAQSRRWHFRRCDAKAGLLDPTSKSLGVAILDANQDGWPDILISNDTQPNKLYMNNGNGTFHGEGRRGGHWLQRGRNRARRHGRGRRGLRSLRLSERAHHEFRESDGLRSITTSATAYLWTKRRNRKWAMPAC